MLKAPTPCTFNDGALFLEHRAGQPVNYKGDIDTVFACLTSNLGTLGCGEEHPLQAFEFALAAQGVGNEAQQQAFLRRSALLGLVFLTDEDDCSAAPNDGLFGDFPELRGESASLRCATRAHRCGGQNLTDIDPPSYPTKGAYAHKFHDCEARMSDECSDVLDTSTPTNCNPLKSVAELASEMKALKSDPNKQILVAGIFGWPLNDVDMASAEYKIAPVPNPNTADILHPTVYDYWPICYDPDHRPTTPDPATGFDRDAAAWGATGGLRNAAFVDKFGENGLKFSACQRDYSEAMNAIGQALARNLQSLCFDDKLVDSNPATADVEADCRVVYRVPTQDPEDPTMIVYQDGALLPQCPAGAENGKVAADCWQLVRDLIRCPKRGQLVNVLRSAQSIAGMPQVPSGTMLRMQCRTCPIPTSEGQGFPGCDY